MKSPTQLTLATFRTLGWSVEIVEHWNAHAKIRQDFGGMFDLIAWRPCEGERSASLPEPSGGGIVGIQVTDLTHVANRCHKIACNGYAVSWLSAWGRIQVWGWGLSGRGQIKAIKPRIMVGVEESGRVEWEERRYVGE